MSRPPYIPPEHRPIRWSRHTFWSEARDPGAMVLPGLLEETLAEVERRLGYRLRRPLHLCRYRTNAQARLHLDRRVAPGALLAPAQTPEHAVVVCQSGEAHPSNADPDRMRRHLAHELVHVAAADLSGGCKRLGDGDRGLRTRRWREEGLAEVVALQVAGRPLPAGTGALPPRTLDLILEDLEHPRRGQAFREAAARMGRVVERRGLQPTFRRLPLPPPILLRTPRLHVRPAAPTDAGLLASLWSDPRVMTAVGFPAGLPLTEETIARRIDREGADPEATPFDRLLVVVRSADHVPLGECHLHTPDRRGIASTDIKLLPAHQGVGHGTEVKCALLAYLFEHTDCRAVEATPGRDNPASIRMQEAVGGELVGVGTMTPAAEPQTPTIPVSYLIYRVTRERWAARPRGRSATMHR